MQGIDSNQLESQSKQSLFSKTKKSVKAAEPECLLMVLRYYNILCALAAFSVGVQAMISVVKNQWKDDDAEGGANGFSIFMISVTLLFLSGLVFIVDMPLTICGERGESWKLILARNFGFLFAHRGRASVMFFLCTLCFCTIDSGVSGNVWKGIAGSVILINGVATCFIYFVHPSFSDVDLFPNPSEDMQTQGNRETIQKNSSFDSKFTGSINQTTTQDIYGNSPFAIEESDSELPVYDEELNGRSSGTLANT